MFAMLHFIPALCNKRVHACFSSVLLLIHAMHAHIFVVYVDLVLLGFCFLLCMHRIGILVGFDHSTPAQMGY